MIRAKLAAMRYAAVALLVACSGGGAAPVHPVEDAAARPLGMNDVSMLLPLPRDLGAPVIAGLGGQGEEQIDRRWFDALVTARGDIAPRTGGPVAFEDFTSWGCASIGAIGRRSGQLSRSPHNSCRAVLSASSSWSAHTLLNVSIH